jgi:hypothetical protein
MLKLDQVIEVAPFASIPAYWKQAIVTDIGEEVTVEYMLGLEPRKFSFFYDGYEHDEQVRA